MKTLKKSTSFLYRIMLTLLAVVIGASSGVTMAAASDLPDAGKVNAGADGDGGSDLTMYAIILVIVAIICIALAVYIMRTRGSRV